AEVIRTIYGYSFELVQVTSISDLPNFNGSTVFIAAQNELCTIQLTPAIDFHLSMDSQLGSILVVNGIQNDAYVSEIQHVRRRETIAMTPANTLVALRSFVGEKVNYSTNSDLASNKKSVLVSIAEITGSSTDALVASS